MPFWNDSTVEPKRQFRWLLYLPTNTGDPAAPAIQTYSIRSVKKPSFKVGETPVNFIGHQFKYPGRMTWNNVDVTLIDPIDPDTSGVLSRVIQASGYRIPDNLENASFSFSKASSVNALGTPRIVQIDAGDPNAAAATARNPREIEEWTLVNAWVVSVDFGQLSYTSEDLVEVKLNISYDYARYKGDFSESKGIVSVL